MKRKLLSVAMVFGLLLAFTNTASAYVLSGHRFASGIGGTGYYTVPSNATYTYGGTTEWYGSIIRDSVSRWNTRVDYISSSQPQNINFVETTNKSASTVDYYVDAYGNTGWRGITEFYAWGGARLDNGWDFPTQNWDWCKINLNVTEIQSNSYNDKFGSSAHEFGHTFGLKHSNTSFAVMWSNWTERQVVPTSDDEAGIRAIY